MHNDRRSNDCMRSDTDRRLGSDRRVDENSPKAPFADSNGIKVTVERRRTPDRRLNSIAVEWLDHAEESCA